MGSRIVPGSQGNHLTWDEFIEETDRQNLTDRIVKITHENSEVRIAQFISKQIMFLVELNSTLFKFLNNRIYMYQGGANLFDRTFKIRTIQITSPEEILAEREQIVSELSTIFPQPISRIMVNYTDDFPE